METVSSSDGSPLCVENEVYVSAKPTASSKFSIAPPVQYVSPELESPNDPFSFCSGGGNERPSPYPSLKAAWDMDTLKRSICSALAGTGDVHSIIETCTFKPREQAFTTLINMCGQLRDWQKAVEVFDAMTSVRRVKPNTYTYSALIAACSSAGEWVHALEFFDQMKTAAKSDKDCTPNEVTYSSLITACERGGQFEKALDIYDEMIANNVTGDHIAFSSVLSACEKSKNWPIAEKILIEMHSKGLLASSVIYSEMLLHYSEQGDWPRAFAMCMSLQAASQDSSEGTRKAKPRQKGRQTEVMVTAPSPPQSVTTQSPKTTPRPRLTTEPERQDSGISSNGSIAPSPTVRPPWDMETLKRAICFAKTGTGEVSRTLESCSFRPREQAFTALINMCGRLRDWQKAVEVFEAMKTVRGIMPNTYTYSALIAACSSSGEWERALTVFEAMKATARVDKGCIPNEVTYSALITACQRGGMFERALGLFSEMLERGVKPDHITYSSVLTACGKSENWNRIEEILDVMHAQGFCGPQSIYTELINHYADYGAYTKALQVHMAVRMLGQRPDENMKKSLMRALEKGEQYELMLDLFEEFQSNGTVTDPEIMNSVFRAQSMISRRQGIHIQQLSGRGGGGHHQLMSQRKAPANRYQSPYCIDASAPGDAMHHHRARRQLPVQFQEMNLNSPAATPRRRTSLDARRRF